MTGGRRLAQLLASELLAREDGPLAGLELTGVDREAGEGLADGEEVRAYRVALDGTVLADCFVQPDRVRLEFRVGLDRLPGVAERAGLRVRPKLVDPPRAVVFVEDSAQVKHVLPVVGTVAEAVRNG